MTTSSHERTDVYASITDQIIAAMKWLNLDHDEGPFFQMQRIERYREVIAQMLEAGTAYLCYCSPAEVDAMREAQRARGEKTHYDGRWRPEPEERRQPAARFCKISKAGSVLPSSTSRKAPPPVEM